MSARDKRGAGKALQSCLIVESGSGEVYIVENDQESPVDRILRNAKESSKSTRATRIKTEIKEEAEDTAVK